MINDTGEERGAGRKVSGGGGGRRDAIKRDLKMRIGHLPNDHSEEARRGGGGGGGKTYTHELIKKTQAATGRRVSLMRGFFF